MMKKRLSVLLAALVLTACLPLGAVSVSAEKSGTTGDCTWTLDGTHLTISGSGAMGGYDNANFPAPWGKSITSVTIEDSVTYIGAYAFADCDSLTSVTIGDSVTTIWYGAFSGCTSLTAVTIPDSVTSIGNLAFNNCDSLTSVTIPDSVTTIGDNAFSGCTALTSINVNENNSAYCDVEGVLFTKDKTTLVRYPGGKKDYDIPGSVTSIGNLAFYGCTSLTSVTIPDSVTTIGVGAFAGCTSLTSVTIPDSVTTIGESAFRDCDSLTSVIIGDSVTTIGGAAFRDCTSLTDVYYGGNKTDRAIIAVDSSNEPLQNATWHYGSKSAEENRPSAGNGFNWWMVVAVVSLIANAALLFLLLEKKKSA